MDKIGEPEEMQRKVSEMLLNAGNIRLLSTEINASTDLEVYARPLTYDVVLGGKSIVSLNHPENAITIYQIMRADLKGEVYDG